MAGSRDARLPPGARRRASCGRAYEAVFGAFPADGGPRLRQPRVRGGGQGAGRATSAASSAATRPSTSSSRACARAIPPAWPRSPSPRAAGSKIFVGRGPVPHLPRGAELHRRRVPRHRRAAAAGPRRRTPAARTASPGCAATSSRPAARFSDDRAGRGRAQHRVPRPERAVRRPGEDARACATSPRPRPTCTRASWPPCATSSATTRRWRGGRRRARTTRRSSSPCASTSGETADLIAFLESLTGAAAAAGAPPPARRPQIKKGAPEGSPRDDCLLTGRTA